MRISDSVAHCSTRRAQKGTFLRLQTMPGHSYPFSRSCGSRRSGSQQPHHARKLLSGGRSQGGDHRLRQSLQPSPISRNPRQPDTRRCLLRTRLNNTCGEREREREKRSKSRLFRTGALSISAEQRNVNQQSQIPPYQKQAACADSFDDGQVKLYRLSTIHDDMGEVFCA